MSATGFGVNSIDYCYFYWFKTQVKKAGLYSLGVALMLSLLLFSLFFYDGDSLTYDPLHCKSLGKGLCPMMLKLMQQVHLMLKLLLPDVSSDVGNPHEISEGNSTSSSDSSMSTGSAFALLVVLGYLYLLAQFFYPTVIITGLIILWKIVIFR